MFCFVFCELLAEVFVVSEGLPLLLLLRVFLADENVKAGPAPGHL